MADDSVLPANRLRNLRRRVGRARRGNTCAASRHLHQMALGLLGDGYPMLQEEPEHCAAAMLSVLESLWKLRTELARNTR